MRSAALTTLTALFLCVGLAAHAGPANLVSSVGRVEVDGAPARAGIALRPAAVLQTRAGGVVQVLIGWRLALAAGGRCKLQLKPEGLVVRSDHCLLRLSGAGGSLELAGWRLKLGQGGGTLLLDGERLFITAGRVHLHAAGGKAYQLKAGQATDLAVGGPAVALGRASPPPSVLKLSRTFQPPPPWTPQGQAVDLSAIQRARGQMQQQQQREREAASCGCTEGGSTSGPIGTVGPDGGPSIEGRTAGLRLRINGLPRKTK